MMPDSKLANLIAGSKFIITAEFQPRAGTDHSTIEAIARDMKSGPVAVNVSDNHYGIAMSSLAGSVALAKAGIEPVYQIITRDRNRIAIQSDLIGAAYLGIKNVLCLSGYHQTLTGSQSANVYDIDSTQLIGLVKGMNEGRLLDGMQLEGSFAMLTGAVANPNLKPLELNLLRVGKKVEAGASFIQTQAVFDIIKFQEWLEAARREGITERTTILAGVLPLSSASEAVRLRETYTDTVIPDEVVHRLKAAGDEQAQRKEGITICAEIIKKLKGMAGLRGIHIISGGNESSVPELISTFL